MDTGNKLDERLEEILGTHHYSGTFNEIKQAFIDDGWVKIPTAEKKDGVLYVNGVDPVMKFDGVKVTAIKLMTGQDWYDSFSEQLEKVTADKYHGGFALFDDVTEAAKKAAGIE